MPKALDIYKLEVSLRVKCEEKSKNPKYEKFPQRLKQSKDISKEVKAFFPVLMKVELRVHKNDVDSEYYVQIHNSVCCSCSPFLVLIIM